MSAVTSYPEVSEAWSLYRRSQEIPWPMVGGGKVMRAQSRLFHLVKDPACRGAGPDLDAIRGAAADLTEAVRRTCGTAAAEYVRGQQATEGERAA